MSDFTDWKTEPTFPDGNFDDYWLGTPAYDNTRLLEQPGWYPIDLVLGSMRNYEIRTWTPDRDAVESLIDNEGERGGGRQGGSREYAAVVAALTAAGTRARVWEDKTMTGKEQRGRAT